MHILPKITLIENQHLLWNFVVFLTALQVVYIIFSYLTVQNWWDSGHSLYKMAPT